MDEDCETLGYAHVPAPVEPGDLVALEHGRVPRRRRRRQPRGLPDRSPHPGALGASVDRPALTNAWCEVDDLLTAETGSVRATSGRAVRALQASRRARFRQRCPPQRGVTPSRRCSESRRALIVKVLPQTKQRTATRSGARRSATAVSRSSLRGAAAPARDPCPGTRRRRLRDPRSGSRGRGRAGGRRPRLEAGPRPLEPPPARRSPQGCARSCARPRLPPAPAESEAGARRARAAGDGSAEGRTARRRSYSRPLAFVTACSSACRPICLIWSDRGLRTPSRARPAADSSRGRSPARRVRGLGETLDRVGSARGHAARRRSARPLSHPARCARGLRPRRVDGLGVRSEGPCSKTPATVAPAADSVRPPVVVLGG